MSFRDIFLSRDLLRSLRINSGNEPPLSVELTRELEDMRKFSLNLLMAFLTVHAISPSSVFGTMTLALLVYTINLHITINTSFLQNSPTLSRFLHAVPLLGILCMAVFKLVIVAQSPPVAAAVLLACASPPLITGIHLARLYTRIWIPIPVQMREVAPAVPGPADTTVVSSLRQLSQSV